MDLYRCQCEWPFRFRGEIPSAEVWGEILEAFVELRHSACYGRVDAEAQLMERLCWVIREIVFFDDPRDHEGGLLPNFREPSEEDRVRNLAIFQQAASYAVVALRDKRKRETKTELRVEAAFKILGDLAYRTELASELKEACDFAWELIRREDDPAARAAISFVDFYYGRNDLDFSPELLADLKALEARTRNEDVVYKINDLLIDLGESDEFAAMDRMDEWREATER